MCGILGVATKENSKIKSSSLRAITNSLFKISESRGKEATGIAIRTKEAISVYKKPLPASQIIRSPRYNEILNENIQKRPLTIIGHSRLVTNGLQTLNDNNQPVIKDGAVGVHNGIVTNVKELFKKFSAIKRKYDVDTEIILGLIQLLTKEKKSLIKAVKNTFNRIKGSASIAVFFENSPYLLLATNTGSLYTCKEKGVFIFASERHILETLLKNPPLKNILDPKKILKIKPQQAYLINLNNLNIKKFELNEKLTKDYSLKSSKQLKILNLSPSDKSFKKSSAESVKKLKDKALLQYNPELGLKRCTKCILPETFPQITFDENGVCNYCKIYEKQKLRGKKELEKIISKYRNPSEKPDCIVAFSGGRDSSYGLHYIKNVLKMNPIAYTYDWGMVTDLARRNQARICGKLGVEHIIVSADIKKKRENIKKNIQAWLKNPDLGMVPLFMAGDKQYFYYANKIKKQNRIKLNLYCENPLEKTDFKNGFCGIKPRRTRDESIFVLSLLNKLNLFTYYGKQFVLNPGYLNKSIFDSLHAYLASYFIPHNYLFLYQYIKWDEEKIISTLTKEYDWERSKDTKTTWRIGDGTAPFYNYIYYTLAGFTENETFRSNQIREGIISRQTALKLVKEENKPRYKSLQWYAQQIGFDLNKALKIINSAPKRYKL